MRKFSTGAVVSRRWMTATVAVVALGFITGSTEPGLSAYARQTEPLSKPSAHSSDSRQSELTVERRTFRDSSVVIVTVPNDPRWRVQPMVFDAPQRLDSLKTSPPEVVAAVNAGYFDPVNGKTTSTIILGGKVVADPRENQRLMENSSLTPWMESILNRSQFRHYRSEQRCEGCPTRYAITADAAQPKGCVVEDALAAGPMLLPERTDTKEAFWHRDPATGKVTRDPIGIQRKNARSGVGILADGRVVLIMAAQVPGKKVSGLTLDEFTGLFKELGATHALNLDGGTSSAIYAEGQLTNGKLDGEGNLIARPVKSILAVVAK